MPDTDREREWLDSIENETSPPGLPRPDLNPLVNPLLGEHMGRWAEVYFTTPPEEREQAVEKLIKELQAESGGEKPPASSVAITVDRAGAPPVHEKDPEDRANELPMPRFTKFKPQPLETAAHDVVVCPGCLHKNAAEQRFCGICGLSLTQEPSRRPFETQAVPTLSLPPVARTPNPEPDWEWLQQRTGAPRKTTGGTRSRTRFLIGMFFASLLVLGGYVAWQNLDRMLRKPARASSHASTEPRLATANSPTIPTPMPAAPEHVAATNPNTSSRGPTASILAPEQVTPPPTTPSSEDGRNEFDQGRRYFQGEGVPRNSFMASQWLWKAVAKKNSDAVLLLSDLYARGDGVPRSCEQARILLVAAARQGSSTAAQRLRSVETTCR
jgi:hypothetical protein